MLDSLLSFENLESDEEYRKRSEQNKRRTRYELSKLKSQLTDLYIASSIK